MPELENIKFQSGMSGILAPGRLLKTRALLWGVLLFAIVLGFFFASVLGGRWMGLRGHWVYLPAIAFPVLACWVYSILVRRVEHRPVWELHLGPRLFTDLPSGFVLGGAFIAAMWFLLWSLGLYSARHGAESRWFSDLVFGSYISAVLEELAFRGVILRIFSRIWGVRARIILSSIVFGFAHFSHGSWLGMFGIIINAGITLALLYVITGRLWLSIGMHLGYDFIETSVLGIGSHHGFLVNLPKSGAAAWLTGGTFGPDGAVPAMILGLLINVILWRYAFRKSQRTAPSLAQSTAV